MPKLNILVVGNEDSKSLTMFLNSKYLNTLYTNFKYENTVEIKFNTFKELAQKCKALKIDIVFVEDERMITQGIADILRRNFVNCFALNTYWSDLILNNKFARKILAKYGIDTPEILSYPSEFPIVIRGNGLIRIANSIDEVVGIKQAIFEYSQELSKSVFLEKYIEGEIYTLTSIFDGRNLITYSEVPIDKKLVEEFNSRLETMFINENKNFIGYINSRVKFDKHKFYILGFNLDFPMIKEDIVYLLISAIYQKLSEIEIN